MPPSSPILRASRNAFVVLLLVLFGLSVYQFVSGGGILAAALWTLGVVVFYGSKYYYANAEWPRDGRS